MSDILPQELIRQKRDGERLDRAAIQQFITGVVDGSIADYQVAAMLMAIFFRGLDETELAAWTDAMLHSGTVLRLASVSRRKVDKHSTGGVGDKISLPLAPAVAACGVAVPMISGRGLGHTGGTLDKLAAIPGFRTDLDFGRFERITAELGLCLIGQTDQLAPADRRLYALRDVTATVESIPLIAASIMSKKLAAGLDGLVLDCKVGDGAFMRDPAQARALGACIRGIGAAAGTPVTVLLTAMDTPIGRTIGNALEVRESIEVLRGGGPADTRELTVRLGAEMLLLGGAVGSAEEGARAIAAALDDGRALDRFTRLVEAQGGDPRVVDDPGHRLPVAPQRCELRAETSGYLQRLGARPLGLAAVTLGAGRRRAEDAIDPAVGIELLHPVGTPVERGQPLAILHHRGRAVDAALALARNAVTISEQPPVSPGSRILEVIR